VQTETSTLRDYNIEQVRNLAPIGSTIYAVIRSVAPSGMSRTMDLFVIHDGELLYLSGYFLDIHKTFYSRDKATNAIRVKGTGMDMVFDTVRTLAYAVHGDVNAYKYQTI
jgi:hypothetical protein